MILTNQIEKKCNLGYVLNVDAGIHGYIKIAGGVILRGIPLPNRRSEVRINIEWVAPWMHRPLKTWIFHKWYVRKGIVRNKPSGGITLLGWHVMFSMDAYWTGITVGINIYGAKKAGQS